jgi:hypothetical protein
MLPNLLVLGMLSPIMDHGTVCPEVVGVRVRMLLLKQGMSPQEARTTLGIGAFRPKEELPDIDFGLLQSTHRYKVEPGYHLSLTFRYTGSKDGLRAAELSWRGKTIY